MAADAEDLLIQPIRDAIALAASAASNAAAVAEDGEHADKAEQMSQAAKALAREGERALKKVQSIWDSQVMAHGDTFRERILNQGV